MKTARKIVSYGLYGEQDGPFVPDFVHCELLETRSQTYNWEIQPHLHTQLCQLFLIESGEVVLKRHDQLIDLPVPGLLLIPENTLHGFSYPANATGRVLTLSVSFVDALFRASPDVLRVLGELQIIPARQQETAFQRISTLIVAIHDELFGELPERNRALQGYLSLLFIELFRLSGQPAETYRSEDRSLNYYTDFQRLIKQSYLAKWPLSRYAGQLNITPIHLNRICQLVVGKSASQVLQDYVVTVAKRYLKHTSYSISEIAFLLNFEHPGYFTRLFKNNVGVSPRVFREVLVE
ncbi:helix-turn-helix domain-containing protein [Spirosoma arcticum]